MSTIVSVTAFEGAIRILLDDGLALDLHAEAALTLVRDMIKALNDLAGSSQDPNHPNRNAAFRVIDPSYQLSLVRNGSMMMQFWTVGSAPFEIQFSRERFLQFEEHVSIAKTESKATSWAQ